MNKSTQDLVMKGLKLAFDYGGSYVSKRQNKDTGKPAKPAPNNAALMAFGAAAFNWMTEFVSKQRETASKKMEQASQDAPRAAQTLRDAVQQKLGEAQARFAPATTQPEPAPEPEQADDSRIFANFLLGSVLGAALGASIALLYAPKDGKTSRRYARRAARNWQGQISSFADKTKERVSGLRDQA